MGSLQLGTAGSGGAGQTLGARNRKELQGERDGVRYDDGITESDQICCFQLAIDTGEAALQPQGDTTRFWAYIAVWTHSHEVLIAGKEIVPLRQCLQRHEKLEILGGA
jgi:hypothetical protein